MAKKRSAPAFKAARAPKAAPAPKAAAKPAPAPKAAPAPKVARKAAPKPVQQPQQKAVANVAAYQKTLGVLNATRPAAAQKAQQKVTQQEKKAQQKTNIQAKKVTQQEKKVQQKANVQAKKAAQQAQKQAKKGKGAPVISQASDPNVDRRFQDMQEEIRQLRESGGDTEEAPDFSAQFGSALEDLQGQFSGKLSEYQSLLADLKGQSSSQQSSSSEPTDNYQAFDPGLFTNLLGELKGSVEQQREQLQSFKERDEARDYYQAIKAYHY